MRAVAGRSFRRTSRRLIKQTLLDCMIDPRKLLELYNNVAADDSKNGATLALWAPELLARLR